MKLCWGTWNLRGSGLCKLRAAANQTPFGMKRRVTSCGLRRRRRCCYRTVRIARHQDTGCLPSCVLRWAGRGIVWAASGHWKCGEGDNEAAFLMSPDDKLCLHYASLQTVSYRTGAQQLVSFTAPSTSEQVVGVKRTVNSITRIFSTRHLINPIVFVTVDLCFQSMECTGFVWLKNCRNSRRYKGHSASMTH